MDRKTNTNSALKKSRQTDTVNPQENSADNFKPDRLLPRRVKEKGLRSLKSLLGQNLLFDDWSFYMNTTSMSTYEIRRCFEIINRLIEDGCDLNICDVKGRSPLHFAILNNNLKVVRQLISKGANFNINTELETPLHVAVANNNLQAVCMLLAYGADARIVSKFDKTPLVLALKHGNVEIITLLLSYYWEFSNVNLTEPVHLPECICLNCEDAVLLIISMYNRYVEPFQKTLRRIKKDRKAVRIFQYFIGDFVLESTLLDTEYLDCLYLLLSTSSTLGLVLHKPSFLTHALVKLATSGSSRNLDLIYLALSAGIDVDISHISWVYSEFGYGEETDALICAGNYRWRNPQSDADILLPYAFSLRGDHDSESMFDCFHYHLMNSLYGVDIVWLLKRFSLRPNRKAALANVDLKYRTCEYKNSIIAALEDATEFPSLLELSRTGVQKYLTQKFNVRQPGEFRNVLRRLFVPEQVQEMILFKKPIYK